MATKNKKFTVSEFQTWLEGIMEFQESGWSPTPEQWKSIYQKIQNLKEPSQSSRKVLLEDESRESIISEILENTPDFNDIDFALMNSVLNLILEQLRQGNSVLASQDIRNVQGAPQPYQQLPAAPDTPLANIPLSELRKKEGNITKKNQEQEVVLDPSHIGEEFV